MPNQEYDTPTQPNAGVERTPAEQQAYPLEDVVKALAALRSAARMQPERLPLPRVIAMLSETIQSLREQGRPDDEIAAIISGNSVINVDAGCIQRFYVEPGARKL